MAGLKITTWNIEHFRRLLPTPSSSAERARYRAIADEIRDIDPDVLCIVEGPGDLNALRAFVEAPEGLNGAYAVATIEGTEAALAANPGNPRSALAPLYAMRGNVQTGNQWIWFLVRKGLAETARAHVQPPSTWRAFTGRERWEVHYWGRFEMEAHGHWRHPQVLVLELAGRRVEFIGVHMKSKINFERVRDDAGRLRDEFVEEALKARVKLATEAYDVRAYIEARHGQEPDPAIFVLGDMNDGPGREFFERQFLFFDLVSNIQGDVFFANRFLNHALFDYPEHLRFSARFENKVEPHLPPEKLLDHILFTQALVRDNAVPRIDAGAGLVEHAAHERASAGLNGETSDHRPVSVSLTL